MEPSKTNVVAITVLGGLTGGIVAKKHKFAGAIGGALIGALVGGFLEQFGPKIGPLNPRTAYDRGQGQ